MLTYRVLGPLLVRSDGGEVALGGARQRRLLAVLLLRAQRPVPMSTLVEAAWGDRPPRSAVNSAQSYISRLRRLLGSEALVWTGNGYLLRIHPAAVDAHRFESLIERARSAEPGRAVHLLDEALALWNDEPYPDLAHLEPAVAEAVRLAELHLIARERRAEALLGAGRGTDAVAALRALTVEHPLRERAWQALMVALHRVGQQADALSAFRRYENELATHGLEPSASIKQLRTTILAAPETVRDPGPGQPDRSGRRSVRPPAQLPAPIAAFTGRRTQLAWLDRLVAEDLGKELAICTVVGMAGVGKTALVLQWAHRVRDRFPDGQLFVDLRGYAAGPPVRPIDALAGFLRALGVPPEQAPVRLEQATALYRTLTAGRRMLIVLDNAREPDQVRPLLPGEPGCVVVVTSRDRLGGVVARDGASPLPLDVLAPDEAGRLLAGLLGAQRAAAQPGSVLDLARECAFLPLALRVAAATLVWQPARPIADYVAQLRVDRLTALAVDGDPDSTVGAAFDASYRVLPEPARELFCLLGLVPGPDVTAPAAAALAGVDEVQARALLDRLAAAHLLNHAAPGRYGWHDLLRCYAAERAQRSVAPADRQAALERLYGWYLYTVDGAADRLYPHMLRLPREQPAVGPPATQFADHAAALAWLEAERANLVAAVRAGASRLAAQIADALRGYFHLRRYTADWLAVAEAALAAAPDTRAEAAAEHSLGTAYRSMGDLTAALRHYVRALRLARAAGWREAEATTLGNLGIVCQGQGRLTAAVDHLTQALAVDRETGRQAGLANNLGNLGFVYRDQGRLDEAAIRFSEALELNRRTGSRHGQALALTGLGQVYRELGRLDEATARLTDAMRLYTEVGDRDGQGVVHHCQGAVDLDREKLGPAREHALAAIRLSRDTGDPRTEADALTVLSGTLNRLGRYHEAADGYRRVRELAEELALPRMQIEALTGLAEAELRLGDHDCARTCAELAAYRAARSGYRVLEAAARRVLDHASSADNRPRARMESNG